MGVFFDDVAVTDGSGVRSIGRVYIQGLEVEGVGAVHVHLAMVCGILKMIKGHGQGTIATGRGGEENRGGGG